MRNRFDNQLAEMNNDLDGGTVRKRNRQCGKGPA